MPDGRRASLSRQEQFLLGWTSAGVASGASAPLHPLKRLVKLLVTEGEQYRLGRVDAPRTSAWNICKEVVKREGWKGMYRGLVLTINARLLAYPVGGPGQSRGFSLQGPR